MPFDLISGASMPDVDTTSGPLSYSPIAGGDDDIVPQIEHAILRGWRRLFRPVRPCGTHSRIRYRTIPAFSIVRRRPRLMINQLGSLDADITCPLVSWLLSHCMCG